MRPLFYKFMELRGARWKRVSRVYNSHGSFDLICIWVLRPFIFGILWMCLFFPPPLTPPPPQAPASFLGIMAFMGIYAWSSSRGFCKECHARQKMEKQKKENKKRDRMLLFYYLGYYFYSWLLSQLDISICKIVKLCISAVE